MSEAIALLFFKQLMFSNARGQTPRYSPRYSEAFMANAAAVNPLCAAAIQCVYLGYRV